MSIAFEAPIEAIGERLVVRLPDAASAELPSRGQVAVDAAVNGTALATVVEPDGRRGHWLRADGPELAALGLAAGGTVEVELTPTKAWPEPTVPDDLAAALGDATDTDGIWHDITPMARWEWVRWVGATANPSTRERRVEVTVSKLRAGKRRPCCFDLSSCTDPEVARSGKLIQA